MQKLRLFDSILCMVSTPIYLPYELSQQQTAYWIVENY